MRAETDAAAPAGLFAALKASSVTLVGIVRTRLELLAIEVEEERIRLAALAVRAVAALFLLGLGSVLTVAALAALFWEQRVLILGLGALLAVLGGLVLLGRCLAALQQPSALFRSSLAELDRDLAALRREEVGR